MVARSRQRSATGSRTSLGCYQLPPGGDSEKVFRRGDPGGRPEPTAKRVGSIKRKHTEQVASLLAPGDHQGRPYG
ncbi:MAG TPA: hypothetical protein VFQ30_06790 [Ktedonobacteraceae bacterium]|nr:hypothetical protein [Ktedonobacteraceae bacterium]